MIAIFCSKRTQAKIPGLAVCSFLFAAFLGSSASAQVRTFVASTGLDTNPCSRVAPCRTFQAAVNAAAASGEVVALDSAGFGSNVRITRAISITGAPGVYAGITVSSGDGVNINAGASDTVILRGLTIINQGSTGNGIVFRTGGTLHIESCVASGFSSGAGLLFSGGGNLEVKDSILRSNGDGIDLVPFPGSAVAMIDQVRLENGAFRALHAGPARK
jgi:hypothetical protein